MQNNTVKATTSASSSRDSGRSKSNTSNVSDRRRVQSTLSAEEINQINQETRYLGKKSGFSPAAIVDISNNAKRLWQEALERRGGILNIAKPYFSSRLLEKMKEAGQLGPSGLASMAYKRMVDIFI